MEQPPQAFIDRGEFTKRHGKILLVKMQQQSVELQLNKQLRKLLLFSGLILRLSLVTITMFNFVVFDSIVWLSHCHKRKSWKVFTSSIFSSHSASELKNSGIYKASPKTSNVRSISSSASKGNCNTTTI